MSKARALARAERAAAAARRAEEERARRDKATAARARQERRALLWRRLRLWQHGPGFRRRKETWAALATVVMLVLFVTYLITSSVGAVLFVALIVLIASPALVMLFFDRSRT